LEDFSKVCPENKIFRLISTKITGTLREDQLWSHIAELVSGFHRALLQSITFISRLNALDYTKLRSQNLRCIKISKDTKLKVTPTCFGSYAIHYQGA